MQDKNTLKEEVKKSANKIEQAEKDKPSIIAQTAFLGTLGFIFILPVVLGAYIGLWLDNKFKGYSISWSITLILLGVFVGAVNVYLFMKER